MNLASGTSLGPYEILSPIGAGGMGEVYRARDTRLERTVAVKVLPPVIASGTMRARFDREAKAISGLSHPNICALYDIGHHDGVDYLVMEYLEGETLADKLSRGPLPLTQVVRYGAEIAQALHHAHRRGIAHRDLKPGNIMITAGGAKLLDFGLAKLVEAPRESSGQSETVTRRDPLTAEGTIVGTLPYMSPEHVEGKEVDHRSDIFSLGVILFEMATGRRPFSGSTQAALIASILSADPPSGAVGSPLLDRVVRTALEKNPDDRWQSAHDLGRELRWISDPSASAQPATTRSRVRLPMVVVLPLIAVAAGLTGWFIARRTAPAPAATTTGRFSILLPPSARLLPFGGETNALAISPDGSRIAFVAYTGSETSIFLRSLDSPAVHKVEGTADATGVFWSPDGAWLGYSAGGKLWKRKLPDGTPFALCDVKSNGAVASWRGDTILFTDRPGGRPLVYRVPAAGGEAVAVTKLDASAGEAAHGWPYLLEDGKHFLYLSLLGGSMVRKLMIASLDSPAGSPILTNVSVARTSGDRLLYVRDGKLLWQRFEVGKGLSGDPSVIADQVAFFLPAGGAAFDVSQNGTVVYTSNTIAERLLIADRQGTELRVVDDTIRLLGMDVSPDGRRAAVSVRAQATGLADIWIYDLVRGVRERFTSDPGMEVQPLWTPDGRSLIYGQSTGSTPRLVRQALSETRPARIIAPGNFQIPMAVSPDGKALYYMSNEPRTQRDIIRTTLDGSGQSETILGSEFNENFGKISPDGRRFAFVSDPTGTAEIYVLDLATAERARISNRGGYSPQWNGNGELIYVTPDNLFVSARPRAGRWDDVVTADLFRAGADVGYFDVLPDGRFLFSEWTPGPSDAHIHVATGW